MNPLQRDINNMTTTNTHFMITQGMRRMHNLSDNDQEAINGFKEFWNKKNNPKIIETGAIVDRFQEKAGEVIKFKAKINEQDNIHK